MKRSTKNQAAGKLREVKGKVKEGAGKLLRDRELEAEGTVEKHAGRLQQKVGQLEKLLGG